MRRRVIGDAVIYALNDEGLQDVWYGELNVLDTACAWLETHHPNLPWLPAHPLERHRRVLNALERDPRFEKGWMRASTGYGERRMRTFHLRSLSSLDANPNEQP